MPQPHYYETSIRTEIVFACYRLAELEMLAIMGTGIAMWAYLVFAIAGNLFFGMDLPIRAVFDFDPDWSLTVRFLTFVIFVAPLITVLLDDWDSYWWWCPVAVAMGAVWLLFHGVAV